MRSLPSFYDEITVLWSHIEEFQRTIVDGKKCRSRYILIFNTIVMQNTAMNREAAYSRFRHNVQYYDIISCRGYPKWLLLREENACNFQLNQMITLFSRLFIIDRFFEMLIFNLIKLQK